MLRSSLVAVLMFCAAICAGQTLELYPNVHTIGVNLYLPPEFDPEHDDTVLVRYYVGSDTTSHPAFPMTWATGTSMLRTCIFNTEPNTEYSVRIDIHPSPSPAAYSTLYSSAITRQFTSRKKAKRSFYVSPEGASTNYDSLAPGNLEMAMAEARHGDEVVLLTGFYLAGNMMITETSGPSVLRAAEGAYVTISGGEQATRTWTETSTPGLYVTELSEKAANVNCVISGDGRRLYPYAKLEDLKTHSLSCILGTPQPCGLPGFWRDPRPSTVIPFQLENPEYRKLYVKFVDNTQPLNAYLTISQEKRGLTIRGTDSVRLERIRFKYYGVSPYGCAVSIESASEVVIDSCTFEFNDRHVSLSGSSNHVSILNTTFNDGADWDTYIGKATYEPYTPALCYGLTVPSLYPDNDRMMETGGIIFAWDFNGRGTIVKGCSFHGMMDGLKGVAPAVVDSLSAETDIYDGDISGSDDAIEFDGNAANVRMWNMHVREGTVSMAPSLSGPLYVFRNIITDLSIGHSTIEGYDTLVTFAGTPYKFATGDTNKAGRVFVMHNTYVARGDGQGAGFELREPARHTGVTLLNNIFIAGAGMAWAYISPSIQKLEAPLELNADYNTYYTESAVFGTRRWSNPTMYFDNLDALRAALPYEQHSKQLRPAFVNEDQNDFRPIAGSPIIDAAVIIPGLNDRNYSGIGPDIGAVESSAVTGVEPDAQPAELGATMLSFAVFPNPTHDYVTVTGDFQSGTCYWSIIDLTGHTLLDGTSQALNSSLTIHISTLSKGRYTLMLSLAHRVYAVSLVRL